MFPSTWVLFFGPARALNCDARLTAAYHTLLSIHTVQAMSTPRRSLGLLALLILRSTSLLTLAAVLPPNPGSGNDSTSLLPFCITQDSTAPDLRAAGIETKRASFRYGPPVAGGPFYPTGPLALAKQGTDLTEVQIDEAPQLTGATADQTEARLEAADVRELCIVHRSAY